MSDSLKLGDASGRVRDGDLALFRRNGLIARFGRSSYSHAGMFAWWGDELMILEMLQSKGGRAVTAKTQIAGWPGRWEVHEAAPAGRWPEYNGAGAVEFMRAFAGRRYGYRGVLAASLLHLPFVRLLVRPNFEDDAISYRPPFCSQAVALATRLGGGVDPVDHLADRLTEPGDLARSSFFRYRYTLVP